jgi:predicted DNA-binding ribbon-helix-helix protein
MKSLVFKRSIVVGGHKTSVSLEDAFWNGLKEIAGERHMNLSELVAEIDAQRQHSNLSSALTATAAAPVPRDTPSSSVPPENPYRSPPPAAPADDED